MDPADKRRRPNEVAGHVCRFRLIYWFEDGRSCCLANKLPFIPPLNTFVKPSQSVKKIDKQKRSRRPNLINSAQKQLNVLQAKRVVSNYQPLLARLPAPPETVVLALTLLLCLAAVLLMCYFIEYYTNIILQDPPFNRPPLCCSN